MPKKSKTGRFRQWKQRLNLICKKQAEFERWMFEQSSRVLFGKKSGELIKIQDSLMGLSIEQSINFARTLCRMWQVDLKVLHCSDDTCKLIIYQKYLLNKRLRSASKKNLHDVLGYKVGLSSEEFLEDLSQRWQAKNQIPHEIGLALGYPLKDVWGYMGLTNKACSGCCGWQVFGDPKPSINLHRRFEKAKQEANFLLHAA